MTTIKPQNKNQSTAFNKKSSIEHIKCSYLLGNKILKVNSLFPGPDNYLVALICKGQSVYNNST